MMHSNETESKLKIVNQLDGNTWRRFVDQHPQGNIFHTPEIFQVFAQTRGHRPRLWAAVDSKNCPVAIFTPVEITLLDGLLHLFTTRSVVYGGILCAQDDEGREALALLLDNYINKTKGHILFTEIRHLSDQSDLQPILNSKGFVYEEHLNFLVDLHQTEEILWQNLSKSGRQSVRTSRNKNTVVEEVTEREKVMIAYQLLQQVYQRARVPLASPTLFQVAFDILAPCGMFKLFLACANEHYIGACLLLIYKERIINWYAASDRAFAAYCPGELLMWHTLQWAKEHNFQLFDFGGAGRPNENYGPRQFKSKFGGTLVNYGRNTCVHAPRAFQISKQVYAWKRELLSMTTAQK